MTLKILLLLAFITSLNADYEAKKVTETNLKSLNAIDARLYELAFERVEYPYSEVADFIYKNLVYKLDYTLLKIDGSASVRGTYQDTSVNQYTNEGSRARAELIITYPFYDAKESNERLAKIVKTKQLIVSNVKKYFRLKAEHRDLEIEKLILIRLETRAKARKLHAVGSFDEWLKIIKDIKKVNLDLSVSEIELSELKQILLSYVVQNKKALLEEML